MQEIDLDHEGVKKILMVEITRNIKHSQLTKWDATSDVKKYGSLLKIAKDEESQSDDYLIEKVDSRIEQHLKNLGYRTSKKSYEYKQLRANFIQLWTLRNELKEQMLLSTDGTNLDQLFFQKCNESFGLDLPVNIQNVRQSFPSNINQSSQEVVDETETEKINDVLPKFLEFWNRRDNKEETTKGYGTKIRHFVELVGNLPLNKITSKVVREYKEKYLHIPNRRELIPEFKDKSISEILLMDTSSEEKRSLYSLNQSIRMLSTFSKWCCANSDMTDNPFSTATEKGLKREDKIKGFTDEEICRIFDPNLFLSSTINKKGFQPNRIANYFAPLIMCFTGARVSEVMQLHISDIKKVRLGNDNAIWVFDFNSNECDCCPPEQRKSIKNKSSHRIIPIHPSLITLGVCRMRNMLEKRNETRLFPRNNYTKGKGGWSGSFSHFWNVTYLPKIGLKNLKGRKTDTHSFRHTFINKMKQNKVIESYANEFVGHHHDSMTFTNYSERHSPQDLNEEVIPHISYGGLNIQKLTANWKNKILNPSKGEK
jgi:integrase|tara:strand:+ start:2925 stop:4544 length:1620 start_codon:yes stop_codon:yes gene_type:complete